MPARRLGRKSPVKVVLAETAGFCIGVKRALEMVLKAINENQPKIYTYGPLIHNPQVLELLRERGITILKPGEEIPAGLVVIRAHGIPLQERRLLEQAGGRIIDATCPGSPRSRPSSGAGPPKGAPP